MQDEKNSFSVEAYFSNEGRVVRSAFPIFHYEKYDGKMKTFKIEIAYKWSHQEQDPVTVMTYEVAYKDLLQKVKVLKKDDLSIQYETDTSCIVDVNLLLASDPYSPACPVPRGILVNIPKKYLV